MAIGALLGETKGNTYVDELGVNRDIVSTPLNPALLGSNVLIAAQGAGIKIRVLGFILTTTLANTITFLSAASAISAAFPLAANGGFVAVPSTGGIPLLETAANEALNLSMTVATAVGIQLIWVRAT